MKRLIILLMIVSAVCNAATIKIGVITDTHVDILNPAATQGVGDSPGYRLAGNEENSLPQFITRCNDESVDVTIAIGDMINFVSGYDADDAAANFVEYVEYIDGTKATNDALAGDIIHSIGNHDVTSADAGKFDAYFDATTGIGDLQPVGIANNWWILLGPAVTGTPPCAFTYEKNDFIIISVCLPSGGISNFNTSGTDGSGAITQIDWFQKQLDAAEAASKPVIVMTHFPIRTNDTNPIAGADDAINDGAGGGLENQTILPVVLQGHRHNDDEIILENGVTYINLKADVWGSSSDDTDRHSNSIIEITSPSYNDTNGSIPLITMAGSGHQISYTNDPTLAAHWKLNEPTGTTGAGTIIDATGNAFDGQPNANVVSVNAPNDLKGIAFDGTNQFINANNTIILDYPLSLNLWVRQDVAAAGVAMSITDGSEINRWFFLELNSIGRPEYGFRPSGTGQTVAGFTSVADGKWHMVTGTSASNNDHKIYIDGVLSNSSTTTRTWDTATVIMDTWGIGTRALSPPDMIFTGDLDDARIYSGALTASQVKQIWSDGASLGYRGRFELTRPGRPLDRTRSRQ